MKFAIFVIAALFFLNCGSGNIKVEDKNSNSTQTVETPSGANGGASSGGQTNENVAPKTDQPKPSVSKGEPRTVREFFDLLPSKYFNLEGCEPAKDPNCNKARAEYVKTFLEVEDAKNGYWKSGCDGAQSCLEMALFKRPDGNYYALVLTSFEMGEDSWFLEYKNGRWADVGARIVPDYNPKYIYVPPRYGTNVEVFKKNFPEPEIGTRGAKAFVLEWRDGKFFMK